MSILSQQMVISQLAVTNDITPNRLSRSLTAPSGYCGGSAQRPASMYPDNRTTLAAEDMVINSDGNESIRKSRTAAQIETQIELI